RAVSARYVACVCVGSAAGFVPYFPKRKRAELVCPLFLLPISHGLRSAVGGPSGTRLGTSLTQRDRGERRFRVHVQVDQRTCADADHRGRARGEAAHSGGSFQESSELRLVHTRSWKTRDDEVERVGGGGVEDELDRFGTGAGYNPRREIGRAT